MLCCLFGFLLVCFVLFACCWVCFFWGGGVDGLVGGGGVNMTYELARSFGRQLGAMNVTSRARVCVHVYLAPSFVQPCHMRECVS